MIIQLRRINIKAVISCLLVPLLLFVSSYIIPQQKAKAFIPLLWAAGEVAVDYGMGEILEAAAVRAGVRIAPALRSTALADNAFWGTTNQAFRKQIWRNMSIDDRLDVVQALKNVVPSPVKQGFGKIVLKAATWLGLSAAVTSALNGQGSPQEVEDPNPDRQYDGSTQETWDTSDDTTYSEDNDVFGFHMNGYGGDPNYSQLLFTTNPNGTSNVLLTYGVPTIQHITYNPPSVTYTTYGNVKVQYTAFQSDGVTPKTDTSSYNFHSQAELDEFFSLVDTDSPLVTINTATVPAGTYAAAPADDPDYTTPIPDGSADVPLQIPMPDTIDETGQQNIDYGTSITNDPSLTVPNDSDYPDTNPNLQPDANTSILTNIYNFLTDLPNIIDQHLTALFVPDTLPPFDSLTDQLENKYPVIGQLTTFFTAFTTPGQCNLGDYSADITIPVVGQTWHVSLLDSETCATVFETVQHWIRGFLWVGFAVWFYRKIAAIISGRGGAH